ncbi:MAG: mechanosensitive ion channel family protein [Actinomycetota bacterium]|nr:mechanosensitive ion channel family protein [Actinomycetota bacterium]
MLAVQRSLAESFFTRHANELTAVATLLVALALVVLVNRQARRSAQELRARLDDPVVDTRLRIVRRLVETAIAVVGIAAALAQFTALDRVAASLLASSAIAAAVVGFAARQTLANGVAGILLAVTQPVRIGDLVTFEGETGTVEDVRLTYTYLRTGSDARLIVPNERLAAGIIRNDTIVSPSVAAEVAIWLPAHADVDRAMRLLTGEEAQEVRAVEMDPDGRVQLSVSGLACPPQERLAREADLRAECLRRLRSGGLLTDDRQESASQGRSYTS